MNAVTMEKLNFSIDNVIEGEALGIAMTGMLIVFAALCLVSLFIAILPRIPGVVTESTSHESVPSPGEPGMRPDEDEIIAAIGYVLHDRMRRRRSNN